MIHSTAIIDKSAVIGQNVEIGPYAVIGEDVTIGDGTFIGAHATIECARIGQNCKIFSHASIGAPPQDLKYAGEKTIAIIERDDPDNVILNSFHEDLERRKGLLSILECEWNKYLGNNCRMQED